METRLVVVLAVMLSPSLLVGAPGGGLGASLHPAWPDGCVDRVEGRRVVVVGPTGDEHEILAPPDEVPPEGTCLEAGRVDAALTARLRARAEGLLRALASDPPASDLPLEPAGGNGLFH